MKMNYVQSSASCAWLPRISTTRVSFSRLLRNGRLLSLVALVGLGLLVTASGAKAAGCAVPSKSGVAPSIPFVSPHGDAHQQGEDFGEPGSIVGLWNVNYTAKTE